MNRKMRPSRRLLGDGALAVLLVYAGVWVYEGLNYAVLLASGVQPTMVFSGVVPVGVAGSVSGSAALAFAKPVQIALSSALMLWMFRRARAGGLVVSSTVSLATLSIYLASAYWELLPSLGYLSYETHMVVFTLLAIGAQLGLSTIFKN